jgi:Sulfotransferase family
MLISDSHRFLFFHVSKTAGMSMRQVLEPFSTEPQQFKIRRPPRTVNGKPNRLYDAWEALLLHARARDARDELPSEVFDSFFKFGFVRNPWDWQVSWYHFLLREETWPKHEIVKSLAGFEEFIEWVVSSSNPYPKGQPKTQSEILSDPSGELLVDFVGRYETLERDFREVCARLDIPCLLPHLNATSHGNYATYYNERTKQLVASHFHVDIELFHYKF